MKKMGGYYYSNTSKLGEVLMETMLQEVSEFCKIDVRQNWSTQAHQQVFTFIFILGNVHTHISIITFLKLYSYFMEQIIAFNS